MKNPQFKKIVIIGLGLMGGSLAAAVRKKFPKAQVVAVTRNKQAARQALKKKWIHAHESFTEAIQDAGLIVICTPVDLTRRILKDIEQTATSSVLVTDVGSVKKTICSYVAEHKWERVQFVGAHPMVGSHKRGMDAAREDLYSEGLVIVTPSRSKSATKSVKKFWAQVCRKVVILSAKEHDQGVAQISHLPHLLSVCLNLTVDQKSRLIASTGFEDMTRLARGDVSVWAPIFLENKEELIKASRSFAKQLDQFITLLTSGSDKTYNLLEKAQYRC